MRIILQILENKSQTLIRIISVIYIDKVKYLWELFLKFKRKNSYIYEKKMWI